LFFVERLIRANETLEGFLWAFRRVFPKKPPIHEKDSTGSVRSSSGFEERWTFRFEPLVSNPFVITEVSLFGLIEANKI
jgi:hypothetical protein